MRVLGGLPRSEAFGATTERQPSIARPVSPRIFISNCYPSVRQNGPFNHGLPTFASWNQVSEWLRRLERSDRSDK